MSANIKVTSLASTGGFLSSFIEKSVEKPGDGLNGDCIVHYSGEHGKYMMRVKLVDGKRDGVAMVMNDGVPYLRLEYCSGLLTGVVERLNSWGMVDLRGHLVNGMENGLFEEYNRNEKVVWRGYYRNGERYSEVVQSGRVKGYYDEKSVSTGLLLTTAQYDDSLHDKNGHCLEYENGEWIGEWIYENGVRKRPIRECRNGTLTLYDELGNKTYEGQFSQEEVKDGFYEHEVMEGMDGYCKELDSNGRLVSIAEYDEMRMKKNGRCFEMENGKVKRVCLYENDMLIRVMMEFNGSTMTEYGENNRKIYEGGFKGNMKHGFTRNGKGSELDGEGRVIRICLYRNGSIQRVIQEFKGETMTEYDSNGKRVYEGEYSGNTRDGFVRNGKGCLLNANGMERQYCVYDDGELIRVTMEFSGNVMMEHDEKGNQIYIGEYSGDMENGVKRNGRGYLLYPNQTVKQCCLFENGVMKRVIQEFVGSMMTEYDSSNRVVYEGGYKGDVKNGYVREGEGKEYEISVSSGTGLATNLTETMTLIGTWKNGKKTGEFYEVDKNDQVKRMILYENDEMKQVVLVFNESTMTEYNTEGKRVYEGEFNGSMKVGFKRSGNGKEFDKDGVMAVYSGEWRNGNREGLGTEYAQGYVLYTGEWRDGMRNGSGKEMNEKGKVLFAGEWENGKGKGKEMDENGNVVYEGKWSDGKRNGVGEEKMEDGMTRFGHWKDGKMEDGMVFERDAKREIRRGCLYENGEMKRIVQEFNGHAMIEYDENGRKVYEGDFMGNVESGFVRDGYGKEYRMVEEKSISSICKPLLYCWIRERRNELVTKTYREEILEGIWWNGVNEKEVEELEIGNYRYNDSSITELKLSGLTQLKRIVTGYHCFESVRLFELSGLNRLESVVIGQSSITIDDRFRLISGDERTDGSCRIVNCPNLKSIEIYNDSFKDYHSFELSNLPSLQSIDIGNWCFEYTPSFSLTDLPQLQSVKLGMGAFCSVHSVVFANLPKLQSIQLKQLALRGDGSDDRKAIRNSPYKYKNTLTMRNLPSLTSFKGGENNFKFIGSVILRSISRLSSGGIEFATHLFGGCFQYTYSLQSSSMLSFISSSFDAPALDSFIRRKE